MCIRWDKSVIPLALQCELQIKLSQAQIQMYLLLLCALWSLTPLPILLKVHGDDVSSKSVLLYMCVCVWLFDICKFRGYFTATLASNPLASGRLGVAGELGWNYIRTRIAVELELDTRHYLSEKRFAFSQLFCIIIFLVFLGPDLNSKLERQTTLTENARDTCVGHLLPTLWGFSLIGNERQAMEWQRVHCLCVRCVCVCLWGVCVRNADSCENIVGLLLGLY